jgi:GNAT superfamily N-acetyltransferase
MEVLVRQLTPDDRRIFPAARELLNRTQGRDLFGPAYMDERTASPTTLVLGAFRGDELVSVGVAELITNFDYYRPFVPTIDDELRGKVVGSFSTLCVLESLQGQGVGHQLSLRRLAWLKARGCDVVFGVSWVSGLAHTSNRLFERVGFAPVRRVDDFYHASSLAKPFLCPGCGEPPCTCAAILYRLDLV